MPRTKKKFSETKVGSFLTKVAPGILGIAGDILPDAGVLGIVKNLITKDKTLPQEDKEKALMLLEQDMVEMEEVSKRWTADMKSDSWLSKNTRPMSLIWDFHVSEGWVSLLQTLLVTVYVAYFGSRGAEKFQSIKK